MSEWFRRSAARSAEPMPQAPGGSGASGFGGVGGAPAGPESVPSAGERRAGRGAVPPAGGSDPTSSTSNGSASSGSTGRGRRIADVLPRVGGSQTPEERRFSQVYAEDRVGPMPYPNQASPDVAAARARVRSLVGDLLPGGVDEGTGAALDPLIASWASGWLARVDSQHADHHAVVDRLVGGARRQLADAEASHERDRRALEIARTDYTDARERLVEPGAAPDGSAGPGHSGGRGGGRPSLLGRLGERLVRRSGDPSGATSGGAPGHHREAADSRGAPGPQRAAGPDPAPPRRPHAEERVGPSEPATRPVPIPPSTYGSTFDETSRAAPSPAPRGEDRTG